MRSLSRRSVGGATLGSAAIRTCRPYTDELSFHAATIVGYSGASTKVPQQEVGTPWLSFTA
jgi:hypothetical protein